MFTENEISAWGAATTATSATLSVILGRFSFGGWVKNVHYAALSVWPMQLLIQSSIAFTGYPTRPADM